MNPSLLVTFDQLVSEYSSRDVGGKAKSLSPAGPITHEDKAPASHVPMTSAMTSVFSLSAVETRRPSVCRERESQREHRLKLNSSIFYLSLVS